MPTANSYQRYPGISSTASFFLNNNDPAFGSIFQIGWAFAIGIAFAIMYVQRSKPHLDGSLLQVLPGLLTNRRTCGSTSGGHFNPAVTVCCALWLGVSTL